MVGLTAQVFSDLIKCLHFSGLIENYSLYFLGFLLKWRSHTDKPFFLQCCKHALFLFSNQVKKAKELPCFLQVT